MSRRHLTEDETAVLRLMIRAAEGAQTSLYRKVLELHSDGITSDELAEVLGVSRATFYRLILDLGAAGSRVPSN